MKNLILLSFLLFMIFIVPQVEATTSFGIYPPVSQVKAVNGAQVKLPITLVNSSSEVISLALGVRGFEVNGSAAVSYYSETETPTELKDFLKKITFMDNTEEVKSIQLYPNESKVITATLPIETTEPKELTFAIIATSIKAAEEVKTTTTQIEPAISSLVFLTLNPTSTQGLLIQEFTTPFFHTSRPVSLKLITANPSSQVGNVTGKITVYDMFGRKSEEIILEPRIIPAKTSRSLSQIGESGEKVNIDNGFLFGLYTARASISYENGSVVTKETRFIVLPLLFLLFITGVLFVILGVIVRVLKKLNLKER